jgi:tRNA A-37 threonylcarbamoyl transferase component Bud32
VDVDPVAATVPAPSEPQAFAPGAILGERYRVQSLLGRGAMGVVYLVEHVHMRKRFALKVLDRARAASTPDAFARFEREAIAAGSISDPHIAHASDFGKLDDGSYFLVLEYVDGQTLRDALKRGALKPRRALAIARGVVSAVEAAHAMGIIHRDLKPENIMLLERDGVADFVKVLDFGIAGLQGDAAAAAAHGSSKALTRRGVMMGTPWYMSPEQGVGERVDARADLYAIGVILFEMLTGECPFSGDAASVVRQHVLQPAPPLSPATAGEGVAAIVRRLLEKNPEARFASAAELGAALDACLQTPGRSQMAQAIASKGESAGVLPARQPIEAVDAAPPPATWGSPAAPRWLGALAKGIAGSLVAVPRGLADRFKALSRRRRSRATSWPDAPLRRFRAWRRRRSLASALTAPAKLTKRVRASLADIRFRPDRRHLGLAVAVAVALVLLALAIRTRAPDASPTTPTADMSSSPRHGGARSLPTPPALKSTPEPSTRYR